MPCTSGPGRVLRHASDSENFWDLDTEKHSLVPLAVDTWNGFVFVNIETKPRESLQAFLGEIGKRLDAYPFETLTDCHGYEIREYTNWKVASNAQTAPVVSST